MQCLLPQATRTLRLPNREISTGARVSLHFNFPFSSTTQNLCRQQRPSGVMAEIKIDRSLFQERLSHFYSAWKADKRSGDAIFNGASSILILMGKTEETAQFQKNNAIHVRICPGCSMREIGTHRCNSSGCLATSFLRR